MEKHDVPIEYCVPCSYLPKALVVVDELMSSYQQFVIRNCGLGEANYPIINY